MIDGTVSTLAPIFAAAVSSSSRTALLVGLATALGAGVSMGFSEALSDTGEQTGRGSAIVRGAITGAATTLGGVFHSLPFIITDVSQALLVAGIVVAIELLAIAWVRHRFLHVSLRSSLVVVTLGVPIVALVRAYRIGQARFLYWCLEALTSQNPHDPLLGEATRRMMDLSFTYIDRVSEQVIDAYQLERERWAENRSTVRMARVRA